MYLLDAKEQSVRVIKCYFERSDRELFLTERVYTLYKKGTKQMQNRPMETTTWDENCQGLNLGLNSAILNFNWHFFS